MAPTLSVLEGDLSIEVAEELRKAGRLAWDIETTSLHWAAGRIATCQVASATRVVVVQLADSGVPERLRDLLCASEVAKVFHHAPFDLRFMASAWRATPRSVMCTKIASKVLTPDVPSDAHSLQPVLKRYLDVDIDKGEQTSDWARGVLSDAQIRYAVNDVVHLLPLLDELTGRIRAVGRQGLLEASYAYLPTRVELDLLGAGDVFNY